SVRAAQRTSRSLSSWRMAARCGPAAGAGRGLATPCLGGRIDVVAAGLHRRARPGLAWRRTGRRDPTRPPPPARTAEPRPGELDLMFVECMRERGSVIDAVEEPGVLEAVVGQAPDGVVAQRDVPLVAGPDVGIPPVARA